MLLHLRGGTLVEVLLLLKICFKVFQNVFELQSSEESSLSSFSTYSCLDFLNSLITVLRSVLYMVQCLFCFDFLNL